VTPLQRNLFDESASIQVGIRPELVVESILPGPATIYCASVVYEGLREDKPAADVRRPVPHP